jgi:crotonobetainyl-CoA:carnitine CoA-transferase CaiB-like acyl-CoA transferase
MSLFGAVMLALYRREKTGEGAHVTTSLAANGAWSNGMHLQAAIAGFDLSEILETKGYRSPFIVAYQTRDNRYIVLVGPSPAREWPRVATALGHPEWIEDERFPDAQAVMSQSDLVKSLFSDAFATQALEVWTKALDAQEVTYSVIEKLKDVLEDAQLIENEIIVKTDSTDPDYQWTVSSPITVEGHAKRLPATAPTLGQDSRAVLVSNGYSDEEIDRLMSLGIIA